MFLGYMLFPPLKSSPRARIPVQDWILGLLGVFCVAHLFLFYAELAARPGQLTTLDLVAALIGVTLLLEATRRVVFADGNHGGRFPRLYFSRPVHARDR